MFNFINNDIIEIVTCCVLFELDINIYFICVYDEISLYNYGISTFLGVSCTKCYWRIFPIDGCNPTLIYTEILCKLNELCVVG